jgi:hypothetical protein
MTCPSCGNAYVEGKFCNVCGADLAANEEPVIPTDDTIIEQPTEAVDTVPTEDPGKMLGMISLILGIVSLVLGTICSCLAACLGGILPSLIAIAGVVCGILAMNKSKAAGFKNKFAMIGVILSGATIAVVLLFIIGNAILGGVFSALMNSSY